MSVPTPGSPGVPSASGPAGTGNGTTSPIPLATLPALGSPAVLALDTAVWVAAAFGKLGMLKRELWPVLETAAQEARLVVSAASALHLALLTETGQLPIANIHAWLTDAQRPPGVRVVPVDAQLVGDASRLVPGPWDTVLGSDPLKRLAIATARRHASVCVTADPVLLDYAAAGHLVAYDARP